MVVKHEFYLINNIIRCVFFLYIVNGAARVSLCHGFCGLRQDQLTGVGSDRRPVKPPMLQALPTPSRTFGVGSPDWVLKRRQTGVKPSRHSNDQE